jgi:hypothetical protein
MYEDFLATTVLRAAGMHILVVEALLDIECGYKGKD